MDGAIKYILINVGFAEHDADWNYKQVVSPFTRIYMPTRGSARIHLPDGSYEVEPGYLYIIPAYCMHHYECDGPFSLYYIHLYEDEGSLSPIGENYNFKTQIPSTDIDKTLIEHLCHNNPDKSLKNYNPKFYNNHSTLIEDISGSAHKAFYEQMESDSILQLLISHFLAYAVSKSEEIDDRIAKSLVYIRRNLAQTLEVHSLAKMSCISTEHYIRKFTEQIGMTPLQYIQTKRIQRAQLILILKGISIKDVAYSVGFSDISYFNRVFKRLVGCTPQTYRQQKSLA